MLGLGAQTVSRTLELVRARMSLRTQSISPFLLWAMQAGWIVTATLAGLILTIKVFSVIAGHADYIDPFIPYDAIMPGHSVEALASYPCYFNERRMNGEVFLDEQTCVMFPQNGIFDMVFVEIRDKQIESVSFYSSHVQLGQAALHWQGTIKLQVGNTKLGWNTLDYGLEAVGQDLCYKCAVRKITVINKV
jgi:hypothetical protein